MIETIKELAHKLGYYVEGDDIGSGNDILNALVETAEKEYERGKVEGAEQMKKTLQNAVVGPIKIWTARGTWSMGSIIPAWMLLPSDVQAEMKADNTLSDALKTLLQDVNGVSDPNAAADFEVVGNQVRHERGRNET